MVMSGSFDRNMNSGGGSAAAIGDFVVAKQEVRGIRGINREGENSIDLGFWLKYGLRKTESTKQIAASYVVGEIQSLYINKNYNAFGNN